jgi:hypothetical protein
VQRKKQLKQPKKIDLLERRALRIMEDHYVVTGLNLYFRNALYRNFKTDISHLAKRLERDHVDRVNVKGAIAYKLRNIDLDK